MTQQIAHNGTKTNSKPSETVFDLLLQGHGIMQVRQFCESAFPGHKPEQIISDAFSIFSHLSDEPSNVIRGFVLSNSKELFRRNMEIGDFKAAQDCLKLMLKISDTQTLSDQTTSETNEVDVTEMADETTYD